MKLFIYKARILLYISFIILHLVPAVFCQETEAIQQYEYAKKLAEDGLNDLAITQFEEFLKLYSDNPFAPEAQFHLAVLLGSTDQIKNSMAALRLLMVKYPDYQRCDEALYLIAHNHIKSNEIKKGIKNLEQISMFYPKSSFAAKAFFEAGDYWKQLNDPIRAEESWIRIIEEYSQSEFVQNARIRLANLYFQKKDYTAAQGHIDKILDNSSQGDYLVDISILKAKIFTEQYKLEEAEQLYRQILGSDISPDDQTRAKLSYVHFLNKTNRQELAKNELSTILPDLNESTLQDSVVLAWFSTLFILSEFQTIIDALNQYQHSFQDSMALTSAIEFGIQCAIRVPDHSLAIQLLEKRLSFEKLDRSDKPLIKQSHLELIKQFRAEDHFSNALQHGQKILNWDWDDLNFTDKIRFELAQIYQFDLLQPRQALFYYEQILAPTHKSKLADEAAMNMALCYEALNDDKQSLQFYHNFSHIFPGSPLLKQVFKKIEWFQIYKSQSSPEDFSRISIQMSSLLLNDNKDEAILSLLNKTFNQFKDYEGAIELARTVESQDFMQGHKDILNQISGESYYRLAMIEEDSVSRTTKLNNARENLLKYLASTSNNSEKLRIALLIHDIDRQKKQLTTLDFLEDYDFLNKLVQQFQNFNEIKPVRFKLARLLHNYGLRASKDSILSAINYYNEFLSDLSSPNEVVPSNTTSILSYPLSLLNLKEDALYWRGFAYLALEDTSNAVIDFQKYRGDFPRGKFIIQVLKQLGDISIQNQVWDSAEKFYSEISDRFYYSPVIDTSKIHLALIKIRLQKYNDAIPILEPLQDYELALFHLAKAYFYLNHHLQAREHFHEYLNRYPDGLYVTDCYYHLYEISDKNKQQKAADHYSSIFLRRYPEDSRRIDILTKLAKQQYEKGNYKEAIGQYNELLENNPDNLNLQKMRLICSIKLGNVNTAKSAVENIKKQFNESKEELAEIEYEIANYYFDQKSFETAEKQFDHVKSKYKRTKYAVYAEYGLGKLKIITNKTDEGLEILTKIPEKNPEQPVLSLVYLTLGDFYYKTKQFPIAAGAFNKILELNPDENTENITRKYLIKLYSDVGQYESSLISLQRFLTRFPNDEDAFTYKINLGVTLQQLKEYNRAITHLRSLIPFADNAEEAEIRYLIGDCYFNWGQFTKAVSEYLKVIYLTKPTKLPWHVTAEYRSGEAYMKLKEWDKAKELFDKIVQKEGIGSDFGRAAYAKLQEVEQLQQY